MRIRETSGQILLIAVMIGLLLLISIPVIVYLNQMGARHQATSQKNAKARAIAEEGISFAGQELGKDIATWNAALGGGFPGTANTPIPTPSGGQFRYLCSQDTVANPGLQPYQIAVVSIASLDQNGQMRPTRAIKAYVSLRTFGADLGTGVHAAAALQLVRTPAMPATANPLTVEWGPIAIFDTDGTTGPGTTGPGFPFILPDPMDTANYGTAATFPGYPRKFSLGGITGTSAAYPRSPNTSLSAATSDQKEYWAFASMSFPPLIDEVDLQNRAEAEATWIPPIPTPTSCVGTCTQVVGTGAAAVVTPGSGHFKMPTSADVATFSGWGGALPNNTVLFIEGNAQFDTVALDLRNGGIIVTGDLTLNAPGAGLPATTNVRIPTTAALEYSNPSLGTWLCKTSYNANVAGTCAPGGVNYIGFLIVKGNLIVNNPGLPGWVLDGAVMVGDFQPATPPSGQLTINAGAGLTVLYDDVINHKIPVYPVVGTSLKVVPDLIQDIPLP